VIYRFGHYDLDGSARELRRDGERVETEPKAFELLLYLARHPDRAVGKDELLNELWPRQIVTETALSRCVMKARRAVDDDANTQSVIRTVHGHGYRFVAPLAAPERSPAGTLPSAPRRSRPGVGLRIAAGLLLLFLVGTGWLLWQESRPAAAGAVAVLPVMDRTGDAELGWVRVGLMSLLARMLEEGGLDVVPERRVMDALGAETPGSLPDAESFERIRVQTGAATVLHTSLERQAGLHRLVAVLTHSNGRRTRRIIVGESPALLAADLAGIVSGLLHGSAVPDSDRFSRVSSDPFVNELYGRALNLELQGQLAEAREMFRLASAEEPELFWLRYEIALCTRDLREWDEAERLFVALLEEASSAADVRALIATLNSRGVLFLNRHDYAAAQADFRAAFDVATERGSADDRITILTNLGLIHSRQGKVDDARRYYQQALEAHEATGQAPSGFLLNNFAGLLLESGDYAAARRYSQQAIESFRLFGQRRYEAPALNRLARILRRQGDLDGAARRHQQALAIYRELRDVGGELSVLSALTAVHRARGDLTRARQNAADVLARAREHDDDLLLGDVLLDCAYAETDSGLRDAAALHFEEADTIFTALGDAAGSRAARTGLAMIALQRGDTERAAALAGSLLQVALKNKNGSAEAGARWLLGRVAEVGGDNAAAEAAFGAALSLARSSDDLEALALAGSSLGGLYLALQRIEEAAELVGELRPAAAGRLDFMRLEARLAKAEGRSEDARRIVTALKHQAGEAWNSDDDALLAELTN
jgi:DNA-binding winged helix-turn-helix (wHTH) protein/tetratricopeptide (TPR) repeat protein